MTERARVRGGHFHVLFDSFFVLILAQIRSVWLSGLACLQRPASEKRPRFTLFFHVRFSDVDSVFDSVIFDCVFF